MNKVYHINVVGVFPDTRILVQYQENVICRKKEEALDKYRYSGKINIWNSNTKFNFKETIKLWLLNLLNIESIDITMPKIKLNKKKKYD